MLAALVATLALAGAPATTSVTCDPSLAAAKELGQTFPSVVYVQPDGKIVPGTLNMISLDPTVCGALLYASASPSERAKIRALNPTVGFDGLLGLGLSVALHEANHVALDSANECLVEKTTRTQINRLLDQYADPGHAVKVEDAATQYDAGLPAQYHSC
jgi:hypothetical protein